MKKLLSLALLVLASQASAAETVHFKPATLDLDAYLEMVSDTLGWRITNGSRDVKRELSFVVGARGPLSLEQAAAQVHSDLHIRGLDLVYEPGIDVYRLLMNRDARDESIPLITDSAQLKDDDRSVTFLFRLKHASAESIARNLRSFSPAHSRLVPWEGINYLFVTDAQRSMFKYQEIVAQLDTPRAAEDMRAVLREREQEEAKPCPPLASAAVPSSALLIALFCLIGLTLGFLFRGYVIRRIEGGL